MKNLEVNRHIQWHKGFSLNLSRSTAQRILKQPNGKALDFIVIGEKVRRERRRTLPPGNWFAPPGDKAGGAS
jgi:hypothetical protein